MKTFKLPIGERTYDVKMRKHHWSKNVSLKVSRTGQVAVSLPPRVPYSIGKNFVLSKKSWLEQKLSNIDVSVTTSVPTVKKREQARILTHHLLEQWNEFYGYSWNKVFIRNQSTRWGSCSAKGNLSFNWRIIELPVSLQNYLIVHELCHLKEHNHGKNFWSLVEHSLPNYKKLRKELKHFDLSGGYSLD